MTKPFPHSIEYERALIGYAMSSADAHDHLAAYLEPSDFYRAHHSALFRLIGRMVADGKPVDPTTVTFEAGTDERYGSVAYVLDCHDQAVNQSAVKHYAETVRTLSRQRQAIAAIQPALDALFEPGDAHEKIARLTADLLTMSDETSPKAAGWQFIGGLMREAVERAEERYQNKGTPGQPTGFPQLDALIGGWEPGKMYVLAARPGMGKTALAMNMATNAAADGDIVGAISLEMSSDQIADRLLAGASGLPMNSIRTGELDGELFSLLYDAAESAKDLRLAIDSSGHCSASQLVTRVRTLQRHGRVALLVIDYLQLMDSDGHNRQEQVATISRACKMVSLAHKIPVLVLSQLSRDVEKRTDKRPVLSDLRDSGAIEQDADVVMMLYREQQNGSLEIVKNRHGSTGKVALTFDGPRMRFNDPTVVTHRMAVD
jgi:replicative DNA helicase